MSIVQWGGHGCGCVVH